MWRVDSTLGADGRSPVAEQIMEHWAHAPGSVRFFRSSANFLYVFRNNGKRYFLRFADSGERSREAIEAEVDLLGRLARAGIAVATPVPSRHGTLVETIATDQGIFHAVVFAGLEGSQLALRDLDESRFRAWGATLAKLHSALAAHSGPHSLARRSWREHLELASTYIPAEEPAMRRELEQVVSALGTLPVDRHNYGLVHGDFELDNLVWYDQTIGMMDFDDCTHSWYAVDIALALRDLFVEGVDLDDRSFHEFVRGYAAHRPVNEKMLARIPLFLRMGNLLHYAWLARALDLPGDREYPAWLEALRHKVRGRMEAYRASLEKSRS
jgi:Ser/Thr protein kinase RdoA (MazF antagonist)